MNIELGCQIFIQIEGVRDRLSSYLVGMVPDKYLIVNSPSILGIQNVLYDGVPVVLRYVHLGEVFGFSSKVLHSITKPSKVTFIAYPAIIERMSLRKNQRVNCYIPASMNYKSLQLEGMILNISHSGCNFVLKNIEDQVVRYIQPQEFVELQFPVLGMEGVQSFKGTIKNTSQDSKGIGLGIKFEDLDNKIADMIDAYVTRAIDYEKGSYTSE